MLSSKIKYLENNCRKDYAHSLNKLISISYFTADQLNFADPKLVSQLRNSALEVEARQCKNALARMFTIEIALLKKNASCVV